MWENLLSTTYDKMISAPIQLLNENESFAIFIKPRGMHSSPQGSKGSTTPNLVDVVHHLRPDIAKVKGKIACEGGLLHRLDYDTEGLVLFAKTQAFYDHIISCGKRGLFIKHYIAHCFIADPMLPPDGYTLGQWSQKIRTRDINGAYTLRNSFVKAEAKSSRVRPITHASRYATKDQYETHFIFTYINDYVAVHARLSRGFRHQVRACLNSLGLPIIGDPMYPKVASQSVHFDFWASGLAFPDIATGKMQHFNYK